jgi:hypothetical protein
MKRLTPLLLEEQSGQEGNFTHFSALTADDLTMATVATVQDIALGTVPKGFIINKAMCRLIRPFENTADAAYNTTTIVVGDAGSINRYITSSQLNKNGAFITVPTFNNTAFQVTADTPIIAEFGSMAAKALSSINKGEVHIYLQIIDTKILSDLTSSGVITTK